MSAPTPFHPRTSDLCTSLLWKEWAGCHAVRSYDTLHDPEYNAIRTAAGLIDVSPLSKYEISGEQAGEFLAWFTVRDLRALRVGRVTYLCWCDDDGKVVDDGTVARLDETRYRLTSNYPALARLSRLCEGFRVRIEDRSRTLAALAVQGPTSRGTLVAAAGASIERLRYFRVAAARIAGTPVEVSRTGYTGDLGYEVWVPAESALPVWDAIVAAGSDQRLMPAGLDAMDVARIEAGFVLAGVDYFSAPQCAIGSRKSTPYEIGLGRTVQLDRGPFVGRRALLDERRRGPRHALVGLEYDWDEYEALFEEVGLPACPPAGAWRAGVPVWAPDGRQVGQATSGAWSPVLKKLLALATVESRWRRPGTRLRVEVTVEYRRRRVAATVVRRPFFDPERRRA